MKPLKSKKFIISAVSIAVILGAGYGIGSHYAEKLAQKTAHRIQQQIELRSNGRIQLNYHSISANAFSFFTHTVTLQNVRLSYLGIQSGIISNIKKLTINDNFQWGNNNENNIKLNAHNALVDIFPSRLTQKPKPIQITLKQAKFNIDSTPTQVNKLTIQLKTIQSPTLDHQARLFIQSQKIKAQTKLKQQLFNKLGTFLNILNIPQFAANIDFNYDRNQSPITAELQITHGKNLNYSNQIVLQPNPHSKHLIHILLDSKIIHTQQSILFNGELSQQNLSELGLLHFTQLLQYKKLHFHMDALSIYNGQKQTLKAKENLDISNAFEIKDHFDLSHIQPQTLQNLIHTQVQQFKLIRSQSNQNNPAFLQILAQLLNSHKENPLIHSASFRLIDQGLANRVINFVAQTRDQKPEQVKRSAVGLLSILGLSFKNKPLKIIPEGIQALSQFINKPKQIALTIQPAKPIALKDISNSFNMLSNEKNKLINQINQNNKLTIEQKANQIKKINFNYQKAVQHIFDRLNFKISAS